MIQEYIDLQPYNTFGIKASARFFSQIQRPEDLQKLLTTAELRPIPKLILGEGSNILFTQDFPGLIIKMEIPGIRKIAEDERHIWLEIGAGENWHQVVLYCLQQNYAGIENLSLIPGTVGAAPMQNIGAYGIELEKVFESLIAVRISDGEVQQFKHQDCHFGYRNSVFKTHLKHQYAITSVTLRLNKTPEFSVDYGMLQTTLQQMQVQSLSIRAVSDAVIKIRSEKLPDPRKIGNAGSFFKNPVIAQEHFQHLQLQFPDIPHYPAEDRAVKIPAAWLIEQCGWKGRSMGHAGVHAQHALVLVNYGQASGQAIKQLADEIRASVQEKFAVEINPEVNIY